MFYSKFSSDDEMDISRQLKGHSMERSIKDYMNLKKQVDINLNDIKPLSPVGLNFIENFMHMEILRTRTKQNISFYDFWYNKDFYMTRDNSTKKLIDSIKKNKPYLADIKIGKQVFNLYYGSISIFRPTISAKLYAYLKPTSILDMTMGWGGRCVGAAVLNIPKYTGIDNNMNLEKPYNDMKKYLNTQSSCEIELHFKDALTIDYSKMDYDMVFTSPPYYNKEIYGGNSIYETKEEWDKKFYIPLFKKTWDNLKVGGFYCLNVPVCIYNKICIPLLGEANEMIDLKKYSRILPKKDDMKQINVGQNYTEKIYIWFKN
jgi:hypothetical protein